jgi:hypothetical protein
MEEKHSFAHAGEVDDGRLFAPAAARNGDAIVQALLPYLPAKGNALEIASGTGEHMMKLAAATPNLTWQPTDIDPQRLTSIAAWTAHTGTKNILAPLDYNAVSDPWPGQPMHAVFLSNLTHLISMPQAQALLGHLASSLIADGILAIYGPFKRGTAFASQGDERFDASIRAQLPQAGYKPISWVEDQLATQALHKIDTLPMPANNLMTLWKRPS